MLRLTEAKCFARSLDARELVVIEWLLHSRRLDGSIGFFLHEGRHLGATNLASIIDGLTLLFVDAINSWIDAEQPQRKASLTPSV